MTDVCARCGRPGPVPGGGSGACVPGICADCRLDPPAYLACRAAAAYEGSIREAIARFKYAGERALARSLAALVSLRIEEMLRRAQRAPGPAGPLPGGTPVLIPVPLHATRWRERGYNQAEDLARAISRRLGLPVRAGVLRRTRERRPQTGSSRRQRLVQSAGAFSARRWQGGPAIVIDDVTTTGATLREAARALRDAGASAVFSAAAAAVRFP